jgi:hypothetical protein
MTRPVEHNYKHTKWRRGLPPHLCYVCKRKDVDACLDRLGLEPPFHDLRFGPVWGIPHNLRSPKEVPPSFEVACASVTYDIDPSEYTGYRRTTRELKIGQAPREIVQVVREVFLPDGLPGLLRWLEDMRKLPETATENRALHLQYHVDDGRLTTQEGVARAGSMRSP